MTMTELENLDEPVVSEFQNRINHALEAGISLIMCQTAEWERLDAAILNATLYEHAQGGEGEERRYFLKRTGSRGLQIWDDGYGGWTSKNQLIQKALRLSPAELLRWFRDEFPEPGVLLLDDAHHFASENIPGQVSTERHEAIYPLRDFVRLKSARNVPEAHRKTVIISGSQIKQINEIKHEMLRLDLPPLNMNSHSSKCSLEVNKLPGMTQEENPDLLRAALGMTSMEAKLLFIGHCRNRRFG